MRRNAAKTEGTLGASGLHCVGSIAGRLIPCRSKKSSEMKKCRVIIF